MVIQPEAAQAKQSGMWTWTDFFCNSKADNSDNWQHLIKLATEKVTTAKLSSTKLEKEKASNSKAFNKEARNSKANNRTSFKYLLSEMIVTAKPDRNKAWKIKRSNVKIFNKTGRTWILWTNSAAERPPPVQKYLKSPKALKITSGSFFIHIKSQQSTYTDTHLYTGKILSSPRKMWKGEAKKKKKEEKLPLLLRSLFFLSAHLLYDTWSRQMPRHLSASSVIVT